jgi:hypothetical protein
MTTERQNMPSPKRSSGFNSTIVLFLGLWAATSITVLLQAMHHV